MQTNHPTEKQQNALRQFKIPEEQIQKMSFEQARSKLSELIDASKAKKINQSYAIPKMPPQQPNVLIEQRVANRLKKAVEIVDATTPQLKNYAEYALVINETYHQLFAEESMIKIQQAKERNIGAIK